LPQISNEKQEQKENKKKHKKNLDKCWSSIMEY
jgi:hypothetical protein